MAVNAQGWLMLLAVVIIILLLIIFVTMWSQIWGFISAQGASIIKAINELLAGRPPWLQ